MQTVNLHSTGQGRGVTAPPDFPDLRTEKRPAVETATAAHWLLKRPQTLRGWACFENGPLRPIRVHGRLAWPVDDIKKLLGVNAS